MDKLADALRIDRVELRLRNALAPGDRLITGQRITGAAPVAEVIRTCAALPLPDPSAGAGPDDPLSRPGGAGRTSDAGDLRRGVGFAVGFKNIGFSEGFDDYSTARVRLADGVATVTCACAEIGQGFVTLAQQITREILGVDEVVLAPADTSIGSAGSTSASRQSWISGGAVEAAARAVRARLLAEVAVRSGVEVADLTIEGDCIRSASDPAFEVPVADAVAGFVIEETAEYHHAPTTPLDERGQGDAHLSFAFAAHRAVVDVDAELGLVRLVDLTTSQEVGRALNPIQLLGQLEGGAAQGVGLAVMEEIVVTDGRMRNPSFTDYLIPTALDLPELRVAAVIEDPEPGAPFGAKGVGEPPTISSGAAVAAAIRDATGLALTRVPVRPADIALAGDGT